MSNVRALPPVRALDVAGRAPPSAIDAEAAVLSAVLTDGRALDEVLEAQLTAEHFYGDANRRIFEAAVELHGRGQPVDIQTVTAMLRDRERLQAVGGVAYIAKLLDTTPAVAHVGAHARIVRDKARVRRMIETCQAATGEGYTSTGDDAQEWIDSVAARVCDAAADATRAPVTLLYDLVKTELEQLGQGQQGIATGFTALDHMTSGMHEGELVIVAARPGMGKTSFALDVAAHVASGAGAQLGAMVFSLEMPKRQIAQRMLAASARVDLVRLRKGTLSDAETDRLVAAANALGALPLWVDDTAAIGLPELRAKVRRQQRNFDRADAAGVRTRRIGVVVVDYLQLMTSAGQNRETEVSRLSAGLKAIAKDLRVPVVALSQLNRAVETRGGKDRRPQLSDLRDSGGIEQDADVVLFLYRPEYYLTKGTSEARDASGYAEVIVAKQRNGPTGIVPLTFRESWAHFENRAPDAPHAAACRC